MRPAFAARASSVPTARVMVVDDDPGVRDVLRAILEDEGYEVHCEADADGALDRMAVAVPELVLSDMKMPGRDGIWLLDALRRSYPDVAVIMLTGYGDTETAVDCLRRGATDYLLKPPRVVDLVRALERALGRRRTDLERRRYQTELEARVEEKTRDLALALDDVAAAYAATLSALVAALDAREQETGDHSQRVVRFTLAIADRLGIRAPDLDVVARGALLHDIGKIGVADRILLKPGPLTPDEWVEMRRHPEIGFEIIEHIPFLSQAAQIVLSHQERFDGSGYPRGLAREEIPLGARVFAIADTLDAIVSDRPYRRGQSFAAARAEIARCAGSQFDPRAVEAFLSVDEDTLRALHKTRP